MREILFRGKRVDTGEWVEGNLLQFSSGRKFVKGYEVIEESIGQFTGLTDVNGNKIFEDDVCTYGNDIGYVWWDSENAMFAYTYDGNVYMSFDQMWSKNLEVVGNIIDNPELIGGIEDDDETESG